MSIKDLKIGIIIPAYNVEKYIFRAIESCIAQTYSNIEIVVVDDGSSDETYNVVKAYADKDERIKLYQQENGGVSSARNRALDMCTSDYVLFLDSDDWLEVDTVEKLVEKIEHNNKLLISSGCYYAYFDENGEIYKTIPENEKNNVSLSANEILMYVGQIKYNLRSSCYKLFSLAVINENNIRFVKEIRHGEDGLFVFEYLKRVDKFVYFADPLWNILERPGSATVSAYNSSKMSAITAVEKMLDHPNNSVELIKELQKFLVQRAVSILIEALNSYPEFKADIKILRKKLRSYFWLYMRAQKSIKLKIIYLLVAFAPKRLVISLFGKRRKKI